MLPSLLTLLFWIAAATLLWGLWRRSALWRAGAAAPVDWSGLLALPKRYFVDLHAVVALEPRVARAHVAVAGGAVLVVAMVAINHGLALRNPWLDRVMLIAAALMLLGATLMAWRRRPPPQRLSKGPWMRLPYTLAAFALGALIAAWALPGEAGVATAAIVMLLLLAGGAELALGVGVAGPMKHAVAGLLHLAFHPRPERFAGQRSTALKTLDLDALQLGVAKPVHFAWNQLLSFDACVQCGKCEVACPALAAGQPLNPKKLIQDLVAGMAARSDSTYAGTPHPGQPPGRHAGAPDQVIVPGLIDEATLWSCTTCRACVHECPMLIEHVDAVVDLRRERTLHHGSVPGKGALALDNLRQTDTVGGFPLAARYHWAIDLDVPVLKVGQATDWLLVAGEGAFDLRYQRALRSLVTVMKRAGLRFAVLGEQEIDCGDLARRLGDEATFQQLATRNIALLRGLSFKHIVTPDPHVYNVLKNEYVAFGGSFDVVHHSQLLAQLLADERVTPVSQAAPQRAVTYHDPCYLGRYNGETDAPRRVLRAIGIPVIEMERHGERSRCCGWGGGAAFTDIPGATRIPDIRIADARAVQAEVVVVACPNCTAMLEGVVGQRPEVIELAELVAGHIEAP